MHVLKNHLYLLELHSDSFEIWSAIMLDLHWGWILDYEIGPRIKWDEYNEP